MQLLKTLCLLSMTMMLLIRVQMACGQIPEVPPPYFDQEATERAWDISHPAWRTCSERFLVHLKILASEELATPDRLEQDPRVLEALKPFGLSQAHVQRNWFPVGSDPITLHDTKRWGPLTVCRADLNQRLTPTLEFTCTSDLTTDTSPRSVSLAELMAVPEFPARPSSVSLCPQVDTLQPIQCTLSPVIGDPLVLYVVCRIKDQGPTPPWKSPSIRVWQSERSTPAVSDHLQ